MRRKPQISCLIVILTIVILAPTGAHADAVSDWNAIVIQRIGLSTNPTHPAPVTFLDMAIVQIAVCDAVQAIEKDYEPYHVSIAAASGRTDAAVAKAAHDVLV